MTICPGLPSPGGFLQATLTYIDCRARTLGEEGYRALVAPGSSFSALVTILLTIFIALLGYRMLIGRAPTLRDGVLAMLKVGIVLTFALSWPAYRTLVYDVVTSGPAELVSVVGTPSGLPGASGGLNERLGQTDNALTALAVAGSGDTALAAARGDPTPDAQPFGGFNNFALGGARIAFLISTIGAFALVRGLAGLLLALGPLFVAFLLFTATRGFVEGWIRIIVGAALGAVGTAILLGTQLALLDPWLTDLLARRAARQAIPGAAMELFALNIAFALALAGMLFGLFKLARGFRLPSIDVESLASAFRQSEIARPELQGQHDAKLTVVEGQSRAAMIAEAVDLRHQRDISIASSPAADGAAGSRLSSLSKLDQDARAERDEPAFKPFGQTARRRTSARHSASAGRRDGGR